MKNRLRRRRHRKEQDNCDLTTESLLLNYKMLKFEGAHLKSVVHDLNADVDLKCEFYSIFFFLMI